MRDQEQKKDFAAMARLRFAGYLQTLLQRRWHQGTVPYPFPFRQPPAVKDAIEACGIPHTEVNVILAHGHPVDFSYQLRDADTITILPPAYPTDIPATEFLAEEELSEPRFVLDVHLGKLARKLRLLGFDSLYRNDYTDPQIVSIAEAQHRTVLTRDRGILKHSVIHSGMLIRSADHIVQAAQLLNRYRLWDQIRLHSRCVSCNGLLETTDKESISQHLQPMTRKCCHEFRQCRACGKIYWHGAHAQHHDEWLSKVLRLADS